MTLEVEQGRLYLDAGEASGDGAYVMVDPPVVGLPIVLGTDVTEYTFVPVGVVATPVATPAAAD